MLFLSLQVFIFPNILICYKSIPLKWAHAGTWLFLKLWGWDSCSVVICRPAWLVVLLKHLSHRLVSQGRVKHIHENMPKNAIEPSPKFDSHLSKSANRVTSPLSYRAFELTQVNTGSLSFAWSESRPVCWKHSQIRHVASLVLQQYFFEFAFDEIKARPRHACPYAVVSFQYKGKEAAVAPMTAHR